MLKIEKKVYIVFYPIILVNTKTTIFPKQLKHQAFLLSRRPTGTKLSEDVAYLNMSYGRDDRHGGLQAVFFYLPPCWTVRTAKLFH